MTARKRPNDTTPLLSTNHSSGDDTTTNNSQITPPKFESLNFDRIINSYSIKTAKSNTKFIYISITRWILVALVGLTTGITAVIIVHFVDKLVEFRVARLNCQMQYVFGSYTEEETLKYYHKLTYFDVLSRYGLGGIYAFYMGYNLCLVLLSTALCVLFAPMAVGSGLPEVKAYLNGVRVGQFAGLRLYFIKLLGTVLGVSSGLVVGPEGPIVHLGAILGASLTKLQQITSSSCLRKSDYSSGDDYFREHTHEYQQKNFRSQLMHYLSFFRNDLERRHLISIGAAAGFAAAFGAPVGGLLYSMEEASSFFNHDLLFPTLTATAFATFCIAIYYGNLTRYSMLSLEIGSTAESLLTQFNEIPLYIVLGTIGGILGSIFNMMNAHLNKLRKQFYGQFKQAWKVVALKLVESSFLSLLTSGTMITAALFGTCRQRDSDDEQRFIHRYNCPPGEVSEMGSLLFGSREGSIKDILTDPEDFTPTTLLTLGLLFFLLMIITFGVALPTGMFMPSVLTGSSLGGFAGVLIKKYYIPHVHPSDFALIGAAAFLAGSQRNIVSLCVILMEGTGNTKSLIPVIITVVCARTVGDLLSDGIYEHLMELREYPYLKHEAKPQFDMLTAKNVMTNATTIDSKTYAGFIEDLLATKPYGAFPVVDKRSKCYLGIVRRDQLIGALEHKLYTQSTDEENSDLDSSGVSNNADIESVYSTLANQILHRDDGLYRSFIMNRPSDREVNGERTILKKVNGWIAVSIPKRERFFDVDVGSIMNKCAICVQEEMPLSRVFDIFTSMGLRHLPVVKYDGTVAGTITRFNLSDEYIRQNVFHR